MDYTILIFLLGTFLLMLFSFFIIVFLVVQKQRQYKHKIEKTQLVHDYQTQLLQTKLEVQEQSLKYFSEEIHDNVGQSLSSINYQLIEIKNNSIEEYTREGITESTNMLSKAMADLRSLSHTLNNSYIAKAGLPDTIQKELKYIGSVKKIDCRLHEDGNIRPLSPEQGLLIFRIIQEAVANAIKHGAPKNIDVYLDYGPASLTVKIQDDGSGFDAAEVKSDGIGLSNMQQRAEMLNGRIDIQSVKEGGTTILLTIDNLDKTQQL